ncbi:MAG: phasin family protein [Gammaproteobacteria bacterium]
MSNPVQKFVRPLVDSSVRALTDTLSSSRDFAVGGAQLVARGRKPLHLMTESGLRLNTISHKSIARLMNVQAEMLEGTLVATAKRLETAANANSVRELVNDQVALLPATRERLSGDARKALDVISNTGGDLRELVTETFADLQNNGESAVEEAVETATRTARRTKKKASDTVRRTKKKATTAAKRATAKTRKTAASAKKKVARKTRKVTKK